jgi:hypothetical protein
MTSLVYPKAKEAFLQADIDMSALTIAAYLIDTADYTYNAAHDFLDDVASGAIVAGPQTIGSKTFTNGVFDGADIVFSTVTGDPCEAIIIANNTGSTATSHLIAYIDSATGLPVTPNGGNINVTWDSGSNKIFAL